MATRVAEGGGWANSPELDVFGHVHAAHGFFEIPQTTLVNAALLGIDSDLDRRPIVLEMKAK